MKTKFKTAQEEMVGFAIIIIIVAVILLVFFWFSVQNKESQVQDSFEIESFLKSLNVLGTSCEDNWGHVDFEDLVFMCGKEESCGDVPSCDILNETVSGVLEANFEPSNESRIKGYIFELEFADKLIYVEEGAKTSSSKGAQSNILGGRRESAQIRFSVYY